MAVAIAYQEAVKQLDVVTLQGISTVCHSLLPPQFQQCPWKAAYPDKDFNAVFTAETQLNGYGAAYTLWHIGKLKLVFAKAKPTGVFASGKIAVIDWGCGQGLATLALKEFLEAEKLKECQIGEAVIVEPSRVALERARFNLSLALPDCKVKAVNKGLDELTQDDLRLSAHLPVVHLFSNVLDLNGISLKRISENLQANLGADNYILCVSPFYPQMEKRYDALLSYFKPPLQFAYRGFKLTKDFFGDYTYAFQTFMLPASEPDPIYHYVYYPAVRYRAGYALQCVFSAISKDEAAAQGLIQATKFEIYAPFEFGVDVSMDINPLLAVLGNIICRGVPTLCSPRVERAMAEAFECAVLEECNGSMSNVSKLDEVQREQIATCIKDHKFSGDDIIDQLVFTPLAVAKLQKLLIEAIGSGRLDMTAEKWRLLVIENDVPFARLAVDDFCEMYEHLAGLSSQSDLLVLPEIELTIVHSDRFAKSPLAATQNGSPSTGTEYDLVVEYSSTKQTEVCDFSHYKAKNDCYFSLFACSVEIKGIRRYIYTSDQIVYKPLCVKESNGLYMPIEETVAHLRYFLNLIFRKSDFRQGQLPILNRALACKSVIGLLPTGGGKSLTYQLAAMLQPGVTLVIDPLVSLMSDQYEGLRRVKIDACTYINSQVDDSSVRENLMASSRVLFVFVSPERLCILRFRNRLRNMRELGVYFAYGVIDEVHCVSEWGHDFRYSYLHLGRNLYRFVLPKQHRGNEHVALFGLTATASFDVLADVERDLSGEGAFPLEEDAVVRFENTNRLELQYRVVNVGVPPVFTNKWGIYEHKRDSVAQALQEGPKLLRELMTPAALETIRRRFIDRENITDEVEKSKVLSTEIAVDVQDDWLQSEKANASAIVFCPHRQGPIGVNDTAANSGVKTALATAYHVDRKVISAYVGGDEISEQNRFLSGETAMMVATKAFGMGIDKPNVRLTCHVNYSSSLEGFVQEAGRAGRDRRMALATILYCPARLWTTKDNPNPSTYDYDVIDFFYQNTFRGADYEKKIMFHLMNRGTGVLLHEQGTGEKLGSGKPKTVSGFLTRLEEASSGSTIVYEIATSFNQHDKGNSWLISHWGKPEEHAETIRELSKNYRDYVMKAVYRMCCLKIIDDYTENYSTHALRIVATRYKEGKYYEALKRFLMRYYTEERATREIERARVMKGSNEIERCLGFLTEFVYAKIAMKKRHAMLDIESFCSQAVQSKKHWLEINEDLKDYIYYYFNSKYAREGYTIDSGESFSLTDETDRGRVCSFDIVFKYMRVIDDDVTGADGSPKDNIKHLLGAVRLIRRSLTDTNPALSLLNAYCLFFLREERLASETLRQDLWRSYHDAYHDFRERGEEVIGFLANMKRFTDEMKLRHVVGEEELSMIAEWQSEAECAYQAEWLEEFSKRYTR